MHLSVVRTTNRSPELGDAIQMRLLLTNVYSLGEMTEGVVSRECATGTFVRYGM